MTKYERKCILLIFGSGFLTDVIGEALGTLAGPDLPWVLGDPAGPRAGDSLNKMVQIIKISEGKKPKTSPLTD